MSSSDERWIRRAVLQQIDTEHGRAGDTVVKEEFVVRHGAARVDIAVFNGRMEAVEIKSDNDTLRRLPGQIEMFASVFDTLTLACGLRYSETLLRDAPTWCGVIELSERGQRALRSADQSPLQEPRHMVKLLHRSETLNALQALGVRPRPSAKRRDLYEELLRTVDLTRLRRIVLTTIKLRVGGAQTPYGG